MKQISTSRSPLLRFGGFNEPWEVIAFDQAFDRVTNKNKENNQNILTISAQQGLVGQDKFFSKIVAAKNVSNYYLLHKNDFAYNKSYSNGYPMGAIKRLIYDEKGVVSTLYICFRAKNTRTIEFYEQYFEAGKLNTEIEKIAQEGARNHGLLNMSVLDFFKMQLIVPNVTEQEKISALLTTLDSKINKLQVKIELLNSYKKSVMRGIFSQKYRFTDAGKKYPEWEEIDLGKICKITTGKLDANAMVANGKYRFYTCAKDYYHINEYAFDTEALLVSGNGANVGYIHYYKGRFNAYQRTYVLDNFRGNIKYVQYYLGEKLSARIKIEKKDGNTPYIVMSTLSEMRIEIPSSVDEQLKISQFLDTLDTKINLSENRLKQYKACKDALVQRIFV